MKKYILLSILVVLILGVGSAWCIKHPKNLPLNKINYDTLILKSGTTGKVREFTEEAAKNLIIELEDLQFKREKSIDGAVGWTIALSWASNHNMKWMILKDQGIEYENYLYTTNNVEEYIQYKSRLLKRYAKMFGEIESERTQLNVRLNEFLSVPEGYGETEYIPIIYEPFGGILFTGYEEPYHAEYANESWYSAGGLLISSDTNIMVFEGDKLIDVRWGGNHMLRTQEAEALDDCDIQAIITEYTFDLFTAAESIKYEEEHQIILSDDDKSSRFWYIFFGEEDGDYCYAAFLNGKLFSKEDAIEYARTLEFE